MVKRVLVTTALENTWPKDGAPIIFLGEWCRLASRKHIWQNLDYEIIPYHWDDRAKLYHDYKDLLVVYEKALSELMVKLNGIHQVNHSKRYWRIVLGPWLGYFIQAVFDRWYMLTQASSHYDILCCNVLEHQDSKLIPGSMVEFNRFFVNDDWNEVIYGELIPFIFGDRLKINRVHASVKGPLSNRNKCGLGKTRGGFYRILKDYIKNGLTSLNRACSRNADYFLISSYLSFKNNSLVQIRLGQFPRYFFSPSFRETEPDPKRRTWSLELGDIDNRYGGFTSIIADMIPRHIPTAYLEGYLELTKIGLQNGWPYSPKVIFTSNAYSADDVFKVWAAEMTEKGTRLVIGQHGGHFGMTPFAFHEEHQIEVADRFISWGWSDPSRSQIKPLGNFKDADRSKPKSDKNGKALLVQMGLPRYSFHLSAVPISAHQINIYYNDQERFIHGLRSEIKNSLLLRPKKLDCEFIERDAFRGIQIDNFRRPMVEMLKEARILISTYNATTYLESFNVNFPTLIFWRPCYWELKDEAVYYFDILESVGIFHKTPESAAEKLNEVWGDVDKWWHNPETQAAKNAFCFQYVRKISRPDVGVASILRHSIKRERLLS